MAISHDLFIRHLAVDLDFDWTDGNVMALLTDKGGWTPSESDDFVASILGAGAVETSGTRPVLTTPVAALSGADHAVYLTADPITYTGVLTAETFDTLTLYRFVTSDADSYLIATYDLGAQTGDGADVTINSATNGFVKL